MKIIPPICDLGVSETFKICNNRVMSDTINPKPIMRLIATALYPLQEWISLLQSKLVINPKKIITPINEITSHLFCFMLASSIQNHSPLQ